jgi:hypothetical protein
MSESLSFLFLFVFVFDGSKRALGRAIASALVHVAGVPIDELVQWLSTGCQPFVLGT